jgi:hypothetical protein
VCASKLAGEGKYLYCVKCDATVDLVVVAPAKICVPSVASILCARLGFYLQKSRIAYNSWVSLWKQVAVPLLMAQVLTYPEKVSRYNIDKLRSRVMNGMTKHPGANFIIYPDGNKL